MNVRDTVEELTQIGIEIRRSLESLLDRKEQELLVAAHIKTFSYKQTRVTDFQTGLEWFNVAEGLSIYRHLIGKIVILDFFTYCCINCMHVLPDLDVLEGRFSSRDGLVIIGVHSGKFSNERDSKRLLAAVQRHNIKHPVVNDTTLSTWRDLGVSCWPTLVMIGPSGELLAVFVGEGHREELLLYVDVALTYFKSLNKILKQDIPLQPARHLLPVVGSGETLLFPSKVELFENEQIKGLVIADTGNNRILITDIRGNVRYVIGGSNPGFSDGAFEDARFNAPQGVCALDDTIYVADNENHAIRMIDLTKGIVSTVAGTGIQGHDYTGGKIGRDQALSSPWDVAVYQHQRGETTVPVLLIAMAGTHQIWALFLKDTTWWKNRECKAGTCVAIVGNGREENRNNSYPHAAALAQPSGLTVVQEKKIAFFADSESSAVRSVDLQNGRVSAVCGANRNPADLHDFGDCDGVQYSAKLQHPLGITWYSKENAVYITDTYNHKIKRIDGTTGYCKTVYGDGKPDEQFSFDEPSGIAIDSEKDLLYIADTNNHAVKMIDARRATIAALSITVSTNKVAIGGSSSENVYIFDTTISEAGGEINVSFDVIFIERDLKLNTEAPQRWSVNSSVKNSGWVADPLNGQLSTPVSIKVSKRQGNGTHEVPVSLDIVACRTSQCLPLKLLVLYRVHQRASVADIVTEKRQLIVK